MHQTEKILTHTKQYCILVKTRDSGLCLALLLTMGMIMDKLLTSHLRNVPPAYKMPGIIFTAM